MTYNLHDIVGVRNLTKLRVRFSALNEHRFRHNFDCPSPICDCGYGEEENEHFLLHCPLFANERKDLFDQLAEIPGLNISGLDSDVLCSTLLFGSSDLNVIENRIVLDATISFINRTGRF